VNCADQDIIMGLLRIFFSRLISKIFSTFS